MIQSMPISYAPLRTMSLGPGRAVGTGKCPSYAFSSVLTASSFFTLGFDFLVGVAVLDSSEGSRFLFVVVLFGVVGAVAEPVAEPVASVPCDSSILTLMLSGEDFDAVTVVFFFADDRGVAASL